MFLLSEDGVGVPVPIHWSWWYHLTQARLEHHPSLSDGGFLHQDRLGWRLRGRMYLAMSGVLEDLSETGQHVGR